jgi:lysozyme family protein
MANFEKAFFKTLGHESGYVNDKDDAGGETYMGVSRVYNPTWTGWDIIDDLKNKASFPRILDDDDELQDAVQEFYELRYWDENRLDDVTSQAVAEEMFDTGVNMGISRAAKFLQEALNYLNRNEAMYKDLVTDGKIGPMSLRALQTILDKGDEVILLKILNVLQGMHYLNYMKKSPTQEKYARGWFRRVEL